MFENPRRGKQARDFTTNAPKILDLKLSSEQIFSRKLPLGAPEVTFFSNERSLQQEPGSYTLIQTSMTKNLVAADQITRYYSQEQMKI